MRYEHLRADQRVGLTIECEMRQGCEPWAKVLLTDLSRTGFRMAWLPRSRTETRLWIRIPGLQPMSAKIRWQDQTGIGCEFSSPLYEPVFEHFTELASRGRRRSG